MIKTAPKNMSIKELSEFLGRNYSITRYHAKKHGYVFSKSIDRMRIKFEKLPKHLSLQEICRKLDINYASTMYHAKLFGYKCKNSKKLFSKETINKYRFIDWDNQSDSNIGKQLGISRQASHHMRTRLKLKGIKNVKN